MKKEESKDEIKKCYSNCKVEPKIIEEYQSDGSSFLSKGEFVGYRVVCYGCEIMTRLNKTPGTAIKAWNSGKTIGF